jgi:hypothetical protein
MDWVLTQKVLPARQSAVPEASSGPKNTINSYNKICEKMFS